MTLQEGITARRTILDRMIKHFVWTETIKTSPTQDSYEKAYRDLKAFDTENPEVLEHFKVQTTNAKK